jgi:ABC-2 type transport system permease protein
MLGKILPYVVIGYIVRGMMLKGNGIGQLLPDLWPMLLFFVVAGALALARYRQTLD